jgi:CDP-diacylglycerol--glycerol-3-phosphate 3-phosphatidyltransferase
MANLITASRLLLLFVLVLLAYYAPSIVQQVDAALLVLIIALDGVDGYVARKRREASVFGAIFDIAVDRVVEIVLWVVLSDLGLVPVWAALVFIVRGVIVDSIRYAAISAGETAFGMMKSPVGRFLVAGKFMRGLYGTVKAVTFGWVLLIQPWPDLYPHFWFAHESSFEIATTVLVILSVTICLIRGVPVIYEFLEKEQPFAINGR